VWVEFVHAELRHLLQDVHEVKNTIPFVLSEKVCLSEVTAEDDSCAITKTSDDSR
jgi:hypothetical protein